MNKTLKPQVCFQCGKSRIQIKRHTEHINGSDVVVTESICSDPECQKRTMEYLEKDRLKRDLINSNKANNLFITKK